MPQQNYNDIPRDIKKDHAEVVREFEQDRRLTVAELEGLQNSVVEPGTEEVQRWLADVATPDLMKL